MRQGRGSEVPFQASNPPVCVMGSSLGLFTICKTNFGAGESLRKESTCEGLSVVWHIVDCSKNISSLLPMHGRLCSVRGTVINGGCCRLFEQWCGVHTGVCSVYLWECACNMYVMATNVSFEIYGWSWEKWGEVVVGDVGKLGAWGLCNPGVSAACSWLF